MCFRASRAALFLRLGDRRPVKGVEVLGNNRSVMPLDVLGRTRATLMQTMGIHLSREGWVIL
jgi:hypothetical protein